MTEEDEPVVMWRRSVTFRLRLPTWWWLRWHRRHGQLTVRLTNAEAVTVTAQQSATADQFMLGGEPGAVVDGVLHLGVVPLVREYGCPCGKTHRP